MVSTRKQTREHEQQFPLRKIEKLIKMVSADKSISYFRYGDVTIVFNRAEEGKSPEADVSVPPQKLKLIEEAERRIKRPLTNQEREDLILFGPNGFVEVKE